MAYNNKKLFWLLLIIILILGVFCFELFFRPIPAASLVSNNSDALKKGIIYLNNNKLNVEIAESNKEVFLGLSGRESLCEQCGMLFNFKTKRQQSFVMRDMKFSLDIIFINDGKIMNIAANLFPEGHDPKNLYLSYGEVDQVLEVNGGYCSDHDIKEGDLINNFEID